MWCEREILFQGLALDVRPTCSFRNTVLQRVVASHCHLQQIAINFDKLYSVNVMFYF